MDNRDLRIKDASESKKHFTVPEGYFEQLAEDIMSSLPELSNDNLYTLPSKETQKISLYAKLKPIIYLAAAFLITIGCFKLISSQQGKKMVDDSKKIAQSKNGLTLPEKFASDADSLYMEYFYDQCTDLLNEDYTLNNI